MAPAPTFLRPSPVRRLAAALIVLAGCSGDALAQGGPYRERPDSYQRDRGAAEHRAGVFDYYVLALSWSPTYCAQLRETRYDPQCHAGGERRYAFVLHGLWPQYQRGWPEYCRSPDRGYVPRPVANRMLDIMPSDKLIFNEYRKHGTCSGLGVDGYFALARRLYDKITIPQRFVGLTDDRLMLSPGELVGDFVEANPGLRPQMLAIECGGPGQRLREVRICFDKSGAFRACGSNENGRRSCSANRMYVPPVRPGPTGTSPPTPAPREILPGPRDDRRF
jgi:ribonuclease T2